MSSSHGEPLGSDDRIHTLDILRGLALFGMILVHFHQKMRLDATGLEDLIGWGVYIFVEQKAWGVFAFLFGVGFAILLRRLSLRGVSVVPTYLRRLAGLALFGLIAEIGLGFNILFTYACWGLVLLLARNWSSRALFAAAAAAAMARPVAAEIAALVAHLTGTPLQLRHGQALVQAVETAAQQGSYLNLLAARWQLFAATTPNGWFGLLPDTNLCLFILGLLAVRYGVLDAPLKHERLIRGWMLYGVGAWLIWWLLGRQMPELGVPGASWPIGMGFGLVQDQWLTFTYLGAVILLLAHSPKWMARLQPIGQAGRMALTNYMVQAAVLDFLASGYGLSYRIRPYYYLPAALMLFGAELVVSIVWLGYFRFGPLEWLWRTITYARPQPLLRRAAGSAAPLTP